MRKTRPFDVQRCKPNLQGDKLRVLSRQARKTVLPIHGVMKKVKPAAKTQHGENRGDKMAAQIEHQKTRIKNANQF